MNPKTMGKNRNDHWDVIEERYTKLFQSEKGIPAKQLRMVWKSLVILSDGAFLTKNLGRR